MANFVARYRGGDGHYADLECSNAELERYLVLSCNELERRRPPKLVALVCPVLKEQFLQHLIKAGPPIAAFATRYGRDRGTTKQNPFSR